MVVSWFVAVHLMRRPVLLTGLGNIDEGLQAVRMDEVQSLEVSEKWPCLHVLALMAWTHEQACVFKEQ